MQSGWNWKAHVQLLNQPKAKASKKEFELNTFSPGVELDFIFEFIERIFR